jgi:hypothetical protein
MNPVASYAIQLRRYANTLQTVDTIRETHPSVWTPTIIEEFRPKRIRGTRQRLSAAYPGWAFVPRTNLNETEPLPPRLCRVFAEVSEREMRGVVEWIVGYSRSVPDPLPIGSMVRIAEGWMQGRVGVVQTNTRVGSALLFPHALHPVVVPRCILELVDVDRLAPGVV